MNRNHGPTVLLQRFFLSQQKVIQMGQMDREARRLGWSLVRSDEEYGEGDDYDDDIMDLEASNVILSPLLRSGLLSLHWLLIYITIIMIVCILYVVKLTCRQRSVCSRFSPISLSAAVATTKITSFQVRPFHFFFFK